MRLSSVRGSDEYETPPELFDPLNAMFHFKLDAAASKEHRRTGWYLSGPCERTANCACGLCDPWSSTGWTWCNPPYSTGLGSWVEKALRERERGHPSVLLLPNTTEALWFQQLVESRVHVLLTRRRISFLLDGVPLKSNRGGSAIFVLDTVPLRRETTWSYWEAQR